MTGRVDEGSGFGEDLLRLSVVGQRSSRTVSRSRVRVTWAGSVCRRRSHRPRRCTRGRIAHRGPFRLDRDANDRLVRRASDRVRLARGWPTGWRSSRQRWAVPVSRWTGTRTAPRAETSRSNCTDFSATSSSEERSKLLESNRATFGGGMANEGDFETKGAVDAARSAPPGVAGV